MRAKTLHKTASQPEGQPAVGVQTYLAQADAVYSGQVKSQP